MKSPAAILHDYLNKTGAKAVYELRSERVTRRAVLFHYRVIVGDLQATATGFSKKQAKQKASKKILATLYECSGLFESNLLNHEKRLDDVMKLHPVQSLHDICIANHWYIPTYEYVAQEGPANNRKFTCVARIDSIKEEGIGTGKSKKLSKASAAYMLFKKLAHNQPEANYFLRSVSNSPMKHITALCDMTHLNGLQLNFFHIPDEGNCERNQCLVRVLSNPLVVCRGLGDSRENALNEASMNAMNCLEIVSKYF